MQRCYQGHFRSLADSRLKDTRAADVRQTLPDTEQAEALLLVDDLFKLREIESLAMILDDNPNVSIRPVDTDEYVRRFRMFGNVRQQFSQHAIRQGLGSLTERLILLGGFEVTLKASAPGELLGQLLIGALELLVAGFELARRSAGSGSGSCLR